MGILIDEAIYCMKSYLPSDDYTHCTECKYYGCKDNKTCASNEAHQKAIDIMRKYQKVKRIIKAVDDRDIGYATMMDALHKVVEDGKD